MQHSRTGSTILSSLAFLSLGFSARAQLGVDFTSPGLHSSSSTFNLGYEFTVDKPISAIALGTFDYNLNGFAQPQQVGLWTTSGTLLASTYVNNSDVLQGYWRFNAIAPVVLTVGQSYIVGSQGGEGDTFFTKGFTVDPDITYIEDRFHLVGSTSNNPLAFPDHTDHLTGAEGGGFFGGNVEFVPEPGAYALLVGLSLTTLAVMRSRTR